MDATALVRLARASGVGMFGGGCGACGGGTDSVTIVPTLVTAKENKRESKKASVIAPDHDRAAISGAIVSPSPSRS